MPVCSVVANARVGLYYGIANIVPKTKRLDLFDVTMVNMLVLTRFKAFPLVVAINSILYHVHTSTSNYHSDIVDTFEFDANPISIRPKHLEHKHPVSSLDLHPECICLAYTLITLALVMYIAWDIETNPGPQPRSPNISLCSSTSTDESSSVNSQSVGSNLSLMHQNVQSLIPKLDLITAELQDFDILAFTETWIRPSTDPIDYLIPNYTPPFLVYQTRQNRWWCFSICQIKHLRKAKK